MLKQTRVIQRRVDRRVPVYISTQWMGVNTVNIVDTITITAKDIGLLTPGNNDGLVDIRVV